MRKFISILLAVLLMTSMVVSVSAATAAPVDSSKKIIAQTGEGDEDYYIVAGSESVFGSNWNQTDENNKLTKNDDGTYSKTYTVESALSDVQLKVVKNGSWSTAWGDDNGNNVTFNLSGAGEFTVTFDPATEKVTVTGDIVSFSDELIVSSVTAAGNGDKDGDGWLNNITWDPAATANHMTEVSEGVYEIEFTLGEYDTSNPEFKFAINDAWTHNFGLAEGASFENGVETDATYNGANNLKRKPQRRHYHQDAARPHRL